MSGKRVMIDLLINRCRPFIFTTGLPPSVIAAATKAIELITTQPERRQRLLSHANYLRVQLSQLGFSVPFGETQILPVIVGNSFQTKQLADQLLELGVFAPAIRPPTVPPNTARLRLCPIATHTQHEIKLVVEAFATCLEK